MMNKLLVKLQCAHNQTVNTFSYNLTQDEQILQCSQLLTDHVLVMKHETFQ